MTFALPDHWVWDFWFADDGERFHLYYLHAPKSLVDQHLRHRNARIGHATSVDLVRWIDHGPVLEPGGPGDFDQTATWTGSVLQGTDGIWRMFYTGTRFLSPDSTANVETIGLAKSADLHNWIKAPLPIIAADGRWYERLGDSIWPEEAWRDPWVFADPAGAGWHMILTARANEGDELDRGVIAHAQSTDLDTWEVLAPLSHVGAGFKHLEVPQIVSIDGRTLLLFSCDTSALTGARADTHQTGGIWALEPTSPLGPYNAEDAYLIADERLYSGRVIQNRDGEWMMLAFENVTGDGGFGGVLSDPLPIAWGATGLIERLDTAALS